MALRIDLHEELEAQPFLLAQLDQAVEDRLPVLVAGQVVVGDEELVDALRQVGADRRCSTSSASRCRDLRPCTLMIVQKLHWNGQPRPASKLRLDQVAARATSGGRNGITWSLQVGQVVQEVVDRLAARRA